MESNKDREQTPQERLISLLEEMFQLNEPDLDFGLYKIMHAKSERVKAFIKTDLPKIIRETLASSSSVKGRTQVQEEEVYDHIHRFFGRYYNEGDFLSRRHFTRETKSQAATYAVPYDGREVYLHWANRDQYYTKSAEQLMDFEFDPSKSPDTNSFISELSGEAFPVVCKLVDAEEGEHGNVKELADKERTIVLHQKEPVALLTSEGGGQKLILKFEFRRKTKNYLSNERENELKVRYKASNKGDLPLLDMTDCILDAMPEVASRYKKILSSTAKTDKIKKRPLLAKYLSKYIGSKTKDYFIHKDLEGFLKRELDFYIKNEIMRLDVLDGATKAVPFENRLAEIRALRTIAYYLIDFLAQLENFQRKLWLKKKFVVGAEYCVTLSLISPEYHAEIAKNKKQINEWIKLFAIDELDGYSKPLTAKFLRSNPSLLIDTRFFSQEFKEAVVSSMDLSQLNGTLICAENSQALRLLRKQHSSSLASIYIDPPYNTNASSIIYKNGYKGSSWLSMMLERLEIAKELLAQNGVICVAIDDAQFPELRRMMLDIFSYDLGVAVVRSNPAGRGSKIQLASAHEYALFFGKDAAAKPSHLPPTEKQLKRYPDEDARSRYDWTNFVRGGTDWKRTDVPTMHYPIIVRDGKPIIGEMCYDKDKKEYKLKEKRHGDIIVYPTREVDGKIIEARWERGWERVRTELDEYRVRSKGKNEIVIEFKKRMRQDLPPLTWWEEAEYASANHGSKALRHMFGNQESFDFPKAPKLVEDCLRTTSSDKSAVMLDYFAGSGTTPAAVINLNRGDKGEGKRRYIAVEMGAHFTDVMLPRTKKAVYASEWKDARPVPNPPAGSDNCIDHIFKYLHLESYEDTLNNLLPLSKAPVKKQDSEAFERNYLINYFLNFETKGSPSLLNINLFDAPKEYRMKIKRLGGAEYTMQQIDLVETFNYMIGLHVDRLGAWHKFGGAFKRVKDPKLPQDQTTRMEFNHDPTKDKNGNWEFRKVFGHIRRTSGRGSAVEKVLVIWRKLSGDLEKDNLVLDEWFKVNCQDTSDFNDVKAIYINGSNNVSRLLPRNSKLRIGLIEEAFHKSMWA